jgi:hypothetical protein
VSVSPGLPTQVKQSAGKAKGRNAKGRGNRYPADLLGEASATAGRTQTRIGAPYRRLAKRRGKAKAQVATGNTLLTIVYAPSRTLQPNIRTSAPATNKRGPAFPSGANPYCRVARSRPSGSGSLTQANW